MRQEKIEEIADSYINGNITWTRKKVKRMSKMDFYLLLEAICSRSNYKMSAIANALTY